MFKFIVFLLGIVLENALAQRCPPEDSLAPSCSCTAYDTFSTMVCNEIMNAEELIPPVKATEGYDILSLNIENSSLMYIPGELFKNTKFQRIRLGNTQLMSLSDSDLAFEGLEDLLEEIRATGSSYITTWDWSQLRNHKRLDLIDVYNIAMHSLDSEFPPLESLTALGISKAEISYLHSHSFRGLQNLQLLILKENKISEMTRNMLPNPAKALIHLDLSNNLLINLPDNMFINMPILREVKLEDNEFLTLKEETFSGIFKSIQLLTISGNPIRCDCRLRWLVGHNSPLYFDGTCYEPEKMRGESLRYLKYKDLWCF